MARKRNGCVVYARTTIIRVGAIPVVVEVANSPLLIEHGLGGRCTLDEGTGMLFVFGSDGRWGLWMKDMRFAVDMIWIDASGIAVTVLKRVAPDSFPQIFYPTRPARYAFETTAGFVETHGIAEGTRVVIR